MNMQLRNDKPCPIALTFDDGPGPATEPLLEVLAGHGARATFFLLGRNLLGESFTDQGERAMELAVRAVRAGHALGNHTMSHVAPLAAPDLIAEVAACDNLVREVYRRAGHASVANIPVRLPFGPFRQDGPQATAILEELGRPHCHWTGDPQDWRPAQTAARTTHVVLRHLDSAWSEGRLPIILLHDAGGDRQGTVEAVDLILGQLATREIQYLTIPDCEPSATRFAGFRKRAASIAQATSERSPTL
jgi:peptidoglycan/xylan/chitin deacetylase (PgdA/CDA1 family)